MGRLSQRVLLVYGTTYKNRAGEALVVEHL